MNNKTRTKSTRKIDKRTQKRKIGDIGESVACTYLLNKSFKIIGRNYLKKYGEIDIIAEKGGIYHFIEVKTVTYVTNLTVSRITGSYRPEENVHPYKLSRLAKAIQAYVLEKDIGEIEWVVDVIIVRLNMETRRASVDLIKDIIL